MQRDDGDCGRNRDGSNHELPLAGGATPAAPILAAVPAGQDLLTSKHLPVSAGGIPRGDATEPALCLESCERIARPSFMAGCLSTGACQGWFGRRFSTNVDLPLICGVGRVKDIWKNAEMDVQQKLTAFLTEYT